MITHNRCRLLPHGGTKSEGEKHASNNQQRRSHTTASYVQMYICIYVYTHMQLIICGNWVTYKLTDFRIDCNCGADEVQGTLVWKKVNLSELALIGCLGPSLHYFCTNVCMHVHIYWNTHFVDTLTFECTCTSTTRRIGEWAVIIIII